MSLSTINPATPAFRSSDERWDAIINRDPRAEGHFLFAVRTTGVYCRPGCPARRPLRTNVDFFDSALAAERAGYRPCKRCTPQGKSIDQRNAEIVARACRAIASAESSPTLRQLAEDAGMSPYHFHRIFKEVTGLTTKAYALAHRATAMRQSLAGASNVTRAIYDSGFGSNSGFYANADEMIGMTPSTYRAGGAGMRIRFTVSTSSLGHVLVAATDAGICAIAMGDDPDTLVQELHARFAQAEIVDGDPSFDALVATIIRFIEAPHGSLNLPLDVRGTAFQHRVWQALRRIPPGTTVTYSELAERIGAPRAIRAVAQACATNDVAVVIPCHRVVRKDGNLAGYRWGLDRKRELLAREAGD